MFNRRGFTLMEVLAVVMIIGILTAVALPQYRRAIQKAHATEAVAMLRVINDSAERLAAGFGYRDFRAMSASTSPDKDYATFSRLDMFDSDTIACSYNNTTMTCESFVYNLNPGGEFTSATDRKGGAIIRLYRGDIPILKCAVNRDLCDVYNIEFEN